MQKEKDNKTILFFRQFDASPPPAKKSAAKARDERRAEEKDARLEQDRLPGLASEAEAAGEGQCHGHEQSIGVLLKMSEEQEEGQESWWDSQLLQAGMGKDMTSPCHHGLLTPTSNVASDHA
ncbi:hypothetical protein L7F22_022316 [Adiantum nelumboides]|nr:hypothetical protein [Adiantum nelumboides]